MKKSCLLMILIFLVIASRAPALEKRSSRRECVLCHILWSDALEKGETTVLEPEESSIVVSGSPSRVTTPEMCYSCHDGYVADSRISWGRKDKHGSFNKIPKDFVISEPFRLDAKGELYCGTCHGFHETNTATETGWNPFLRMENKESQMCIACHKGAFEDQKRTNHPVHMKSKVPVPPRVVKMGGKLTDKGEILCQSCHFAHGRTPVIAPWKDSTLCLLCHADKRGTGSVFEKGRAMHPVNVVQKDDRSPAAFMPEVARMGPEGEVICSTCHSTHHGASTSMLIGREDGVSFCVRCHRKEEEAVSGSKHDLRKTAPESRNLHGETPAQSGPCEACHFAHGWAQRPPSKEADPISGVCLACHSKGRCAEKELVGRFSHSVDAILRPEAEAADLPLWKKNGERRVVCSTCHDAHVYDSTAETSSHPPLERDGDASNSFLRVPGDGLCGRCHAEQEQVRESKHDLTKFEKPLDKEVRDLVAIGGACAACHRVHNAQGEMLWSRSLPDPDDTFALGEGERRCLSCHLTEEMKRIDGSRGHPVGKEIPAELMPTPQDRIRLGPLEDETEAEGKVLLCVTCHLPHAGREPDGTPTLFAGGGPAGHGLCLLCHKEKKQVLGSPHDFRGRKAGGLESAGERIRLYGICDGCHANHNVENKNHLVWFPIPRPRGKGNPEDMLCLYCHRNPAVTGEKRILFYAHPALEEVRDIIRERIEKGEIDPSSGVRIEPSGEVSILGYESMFCIRCVTCHDNHKWIAAPEEIQRAEFGNTEMTSFLRGSVVARTLCSKCHGQEGLYRYRYFHQDRTFRRKIPNE